MIDLDPRLQILIRDVVKAEWPQVSALMIQAVVLVESGGDPNAVSEAGAVGLMQLMPQTAASLGVPPGALYDPATNLQAGVRYLKLQAKYFPEIPTFHEKLKFAVAAYNCGRGWVNAALGLARMACGQPRSLRAEPRPGPWQTWEVAGPFLHRVKSPQGRRPDAAQTLTHVARVWATRWRLNGAAQEETS